MLRTSVLKGLCHKMNIFMAYEIQTVLFLYDRRWFQIFCILIAKRKALINFSACFYTLTNFGVFTQSCSRIYIPLLRRSGSHL
jgi:hypothetical protein